MEKELGLYEGKTITNGKKVVGNLIYQHPPFAYILTKKNADHMIVTDDGECTCKLIRILSNSIKKYKINND